MTHKSSLMCLSGSIQKQDVNKDETTTVHSIGVLHEHNEHGAAEYRSHNGYRTQRVVL